MFELKQEFKVEQGSTLMLMSNLPCIASNLFANVNFTYVKITQHWKSTLTQKSKQGRILFLANIKKQKHKKLS